MIPFGGFLRNLESTSTGVNRRAVRSADDKGDLCSEGNLIFLIYEANYGEREREGRRDDVIDIISGAIPRNVGR